MNIYLVAWLSLVALVYVLTWRAIKDALVWKVVGSNMAVSCVAMLTYTAIIVGRVL